MTEVETLAQTLACVKAKVRFKTLANMVAVVKEKLCSVEAKALVRTLANTLAETEMQTLG